MVPTSRRVLAALGPKVLKLAAERSAGAHPYLTTPQHTAKAREAMGNSVFLAPEHKVVLSTDADEARRIGRETVDHYLGLSNYVNNWLRLGFSEDDVRKPGSDRLIDAVVAYGTPRPSPPPQRASGGRCRSRGDPGAGRLDARDAAARAERTGRTAGADAHELIRPARLGFHHAAAGHRRRWFHRRQLRAHHRARASRRRGDGARRHDVCRQPRIAGSASKTPSGWCRAMSPMPSWFRGWSPSPTRWCISRPKPTSITRWPTRSRSCTPT